MQGQGFRDRAPSFASANAEILGASFDTPEENKAFAEAQGFPYRLLSDPDQSVGRAYGVSRDEGDPAAAWPKRISFLIRPGGVVAKVYEVTDVQAHPDEVLADIGIAAGH